MANYELDHSVKQPGELTPILEGAYLYGRDYGEEAVDEYVSSSLFSLLSPKDRARVVRSLRITDAPDAQWGIEPTDDSEGLFPVLVPQHYETVTEQDRAVLSGLVGYTTLISAIEEDGSIEIRDGINLDTLRLLGVHALNRRDSFSEWERVVISGDTEVLVGADIHGDFRLCFRTLHAATSLEPGGDVVPFAPIAHEMMSAYHSTEPEIVNTLVEHLAIDMNSVERAALFERIVMGTEWGYRTKGLNPFGDYGTSGMQFERPWLADLDGIRQGKVVSEMTVQPGSYTTSRFGIRSDECGVSFLQLGAEESEPSSELYIPDDDVVSLVRAIGLSDNGRTSPKGIYLLLERLLLREHKSINS